MDVHWYERFFQGIALDLWRKAPSPAQTRVEADFLERELLLKAGARVLDVPCGLGRHSLEMARRGFRMTGVDLSAEAIDECRRNAVAAKLEIDWRHADMRNLPWQAEFDGAFCFGNSFGYIDPAATREFVKAVARALKPGARFTLDFGLSAESILPRLKEREWCQVEDILFLEENKYLVNESCVETAYTFVRDGKIDVRTGLQWVFTVREIRQMLAEAGLVVRDLFRSPLGEPFLVGSPVLLLVAEKG